MPSSTSVTKLDLKKTAGLTVEFADGKVATFSLATLRQRCPCASCRQAREQQAANPRKLTVLSGNVSGELTITNAHLVGNYALQVEWSDGHGTGIYSFDYLREMADQP